MYLHELKQSRDKFQCLLHLCLMYKKRLTTYFLQSPSLHHSYASSVSVEEYDEKKKTRHILSMDHFTITQEKLLLMLVLCRFFLSSAVQAGKGKKEGKVGLDWQFTQLICAISLAPSTTQRRFIKSKKTGKDKISLLAMSTADLKLVIYIFYLSFDF